MSLPSDGRAGAAPSTAASPPAAPRRGRRAWSLAGRVTAAASAAALLAVAAGASVAGAGFGVPVALLAGAAVGLPAIAFAVARVLAPLDHVVRAVGDAMSSFHDRDFGIRLATRRDDELGDLVRLTNRVAEALQEERFALRQRELLLQTALDRSPAGIVLVDSQDRVLYGNPEARAVLLGGRALEGRSFREIAGGCPPEMQEILARGGDGLFTVREEDRAETFHVSQRGFRVNRRPYTLVLVRRLTGELGRQEAEVWKKVIRIISHELNNSLAPVSSLVHSARIVAGDPRHAGRADEVFEAIRERLDHLRRFIDGYARFARLPQPRPEEVAWKPFLDIFEELPIRLAAPLPATPGWFDPGQLQQVLINLFKNAREAAGEEAEIALRIESTRELGTWIVVADEGPGMDEETLRRALLPFYTTKPAGSGLGLPLCREILEAHGGTLGLESSPGRGTRVTCWLPAKKGG